MMNDALLTERYDLAIQRIQTLNEDDYGIYQSYAIQCADLFQKMNQVLNLSIQDKLSEMSEDDLEGFIRYFYEELRSNYQTSYANPTYCKDCFGKEVGAYLCYFYAKFRDGIAYAYRADMNMVLREMELFLQVIGAINEEDFLHECKEITYYEASDYSDLDIARGIDELLNPKNDYYTNILMNSDLTNTKYLYLYGENITSNEILMAKHLSTLSAEAISQMAYTYTEGFRKGYEIAGIDLEHKKTVNIRYSIGFEIMVREAVKQFRKLGLEPIIYARTNTKSLGLVSTPASQQYLYDHRFDEALFLNKAISKKRLLELKQSFEKNKQLAYEFAGPACIEVFGQKVATPISKGEAIKYSKTQEKISVEYRRDSVLIQNDYIKRDDYSFTIIAYPVPEIGPDFKEIFNETVRVNTLDMECYRNIQQKLIDVLDTGDYVRVTGRNGNQTDICISLCELTNPEKETKFENCLADVNIPVGEVFTSPVLKGTTGKLHVKQVYLEELRYLDLTLNFKDGKIADYICSNYKTKEENKRYIKENILHNQETLPMGEFAIGTNTTAYEMGRKYKISDKLPILIAEKTGPHFAVGDTCYSMSEEIVVRNPDGKEMIAKDNECSVLRKSEPEKAYFNCHTDITIPYDELGDIVVHQSNGNEITVISNGRFILQGTELLNDVLSEDSL